MAVEGDSGTRAGPRWRGLWRDPAGGVSGGTPLAGEENAKLKRFKDGWFDVISMFQAKYPCTNLVLLAIQVSPSS